MLIATPARAPAGVPRRARGADGLAVAAVARRPVPADPERRPDRPRRRARRHGPHRAGRRGDAGRHPRPGGLLDRGRARQRAGRDGARTGRPGGRVLARPGVLGEGVRRLRRPLADHADDERRGAGAGAGVPRGDDGDVRADHVHRRHRAGGAPGRPARGVAAGEPARADRDDHAAHPADAAPVPRDAGADRRGQPDPARADHGHPGDPGVRATPPSSSASTRRTATSWRSRWASRG